MVVSNSSPLVYLAALEDFDLLPRLFGQIAVPKAVFEEVVIGGAGLPVADAKRDGIVAVGSRNS